MAISEKIQLLGTGLYKDIPDELTLKSIPTASELDYIGSEDFDNTMLDKILPACVEESIDFRQLLEIDYQWICRCLRILNYGPYHTVGSIFCTKCGVQYGDFSVNLNTLECIPLPAGFKNDIVIKSSEFIEFDQDIHLKLLTVQEKLNARNDKAFTGGRVRSNSQYARLCYMIKQIGSRKDLTPFEVRMRLDKELIPADYQILKETADKLVDYGLRSGGTCKCPSCGSNDAMFLTLVDERFFRPTLDDLRRWKLDRSQRENEDVLRDTSADV